MPLRRDTDMEFRGGYEEHMYVLKDWVGISNDRFRSTFYSMIGVYSHKRPKEYVGYSGRYMSSPSSPEEIA